MHFLQSTSDPEETSPLCVTFARWFHAHRFSWVGTPAELITELSTLELIDGNPAFVDSDQLVAFLEANTAALRRLGVIASVTTSGGRLRSLSLHVSEIEPSSTQTAVRELVPGREPTKHDSFVTNLPATPVDEVLAKIASETHAEKKAELSKSAEPRTLRFSTFAELGNVIGVSKFDAADGESEDIPEADERRAKYLPVLAAAVVLLVVLAALFAFSRQKDRVFATSRTEQTSSSNAPLLDLSASKRSTANSDGLDRRLRKLKFNDLLREASDTRLPTSQYELATRYAEGIGVKTDKVAACAWLILAHANGSTRADEKLRTISGSLSPLDLQKVRIQVGKFYSTGVGIAKDNVTAHSWFSLAEVAGSADATIFKKRLEAKMTPEQIDQATTRTTSWLSRH